MPSGVCSGCGRITNSAVSNWWDTSGKPTECYAAFVDNKWVKGCGYQSADDLTRHIVGKIIAGPPKEQKPEPKIVTHDVDLTKIHTRRLLKMLRTKYYGETSDLDDLVEGPSYYEIKAELAKREHIPNKVEARKARQEKAKKNKTNERRRG